MIQRPSSFCGHRKNYTALLSYRYLSLSLLVVVSVSSSVFFQLVLSYNHRYTAIKTTTTTSRHYVLVSGFVMGGSMEKNCHHHRRRRMLLQHLSSSSLSSSSKTRIAFGRDIKRNHTALQNSSSNRVDVEKEKEEARCTMTKRYDNESESDHRIRSFFFHKKVFTMSRALIEDFMTSRSHRGDRGSSSKREKHRESANDDDSTTEESRCVVSNVHRPLLRRLSRQHDTSHRNINRGRLQGEEEEDEDEDPHHDDLFAILFGNKTANSTTIIDPLQKPSSVTESRRGPQRHRLFQSYRLTVAYDGSAYCGWQIQPKNTLLPSVQQTLVDLLDPLLGRTENDDGDDGEEDDSTTDPTTSSSSKKKRKMKKKKKKKSDRHKPIDIRTCGRTDAGVNALSQICCVRTYRHSPSTPNDIIQRAIQYNHNRPPSPQHHSPTLLCTDAVPVDETFHPTFDAECRAYAYFIDVDEDLRSLLRSVDTVSDRSHECDTNDSFISSVGIFVEVLNGLLGEVEGLTLDYTALSYGKCTTETMDCTLYRARVSLVERIFVDMDYGGGGGGEEGVGGLVMKDDGEEDFIATNTPTKIHPRTAQRAICFELVGNRFLRRMVRILVSTVVREAVDCIAAGATDRGGTTTKMARMVDLDRSLGKRGEEGNDDDDNDVGDGLIDHRRWWNRREKEDKRRLLRIVEAGRREDSAKAAPADGLFFVGAKFRS